MFSQLAKDDLDDLRAEGCRPTDEDVVRLHELAARITDGSEAQPYRFPRFAVAGGVVFHEPTVAAWEWYAEARAFARSEQEDDWFFFFALANGRRPGAFAGLYAPDAARRAVKEFRRSIAATKAEAWAAAKYATGATRARPEQTELAKKSRRAVSARERERRNLADLERLVADAAVATGMPFADLMAQTPSRLSGFVYSACVQAGMEMSRTGAAAHADYLATLDAIAKRLRAERDAAKKEAEAGE